jgi:peptide/nickel transport system permease protein
LSFEDSYAARGHWHEALSHLVRDWAALTGLAIVVVLVVCAIFAPLIAPYDPNVQHVTGLSPLGDPRSPSKEFLLGTDSLGRDELSRLLYGARVSLAVGIGANLLAAFMAVVVGGLAGMAGPGAQNALMRAIDVIVSFPMLLLAITLLTIVPASVGSLVLIIGIAFGAYLTRIVFSQVVSIKEREYVLAARTAGVSTPKIVFRHVFPHVLPIVLVYATLGVATAIMLEATLSYVGIGIRPPDASWGNMLADGQAYFATSAWLLAFPGIAIVLAMLGFSLLGDGLRDALDPTLDHDSKKVRG